MKKIWKKLELPFFLLNGTLIFGAIGYHFIYPEVPWQKLFFMTGITLSTVGYGDVLSVENNPSAMAFTMLLILLGMGVVLYSISNMTAFVIEGNLKNLFRQQKVRRKAKNMKNHYIVCGAGETGIHVIREMYQTLQDFIIIDVDESIQERMLEEFPKANILFEDATFDKTLHEANIQQARGLVATLSNDKDNLYLLVSARMLNPNITIVAKAVDMEIMAKLKKAGANYVVSPNFIGGMRMASEILRPNVVSFLDRMLRGKDKSIRVEEIVLPKGNYDTLGDLKIAEKTNVNIIAYSDQEGEFLYNPDPRQKVKEDGVLLFIATPEQKKKIENLFISPFEKLAS